MKKITIFAAMLFALCLFSFPANAQDSSGSSNSTMASASTKTVTGCLQKTEKTGHYKLKADDGGTYWLRSSSVKLGEHVGHTVTVTGTEMMSHSSASTDANGQSDTTAKPRHEGLKVTDLTMVSDSCQAAK
ncbi:MAG: DUF5818 domain-containing protein [Candidatus Acidiferrales bacterium]